MKSTIKPSFPCRRNDEISRFTIIIKTAVDRLNRSEKPVFIAVSQLLPFLGLSILLFFGKFDNTFQTSGHELLFFDNDCTQVDCPG